MTNKIIAFIKKETVLSAAWILAVISAFIVHPSKEYLSYIDFNTLMLLFCLMAVMAGFRKLGAFEKCSEYLLGNTFGSCLHAFLFQHGDHKRRRPHRIRSAGNHHLENVRP